MVVVGLQAEQFQSGVGLTRIVAVEKVVLHNPHVYTTPKSVHRGLESTNSQACAWPCLVDRCSRRVLSH